MKKEILSKIAVRRKVSDSHYVMNNKQAYESTLPELLKITDNLTHFIELQAISDWHINLFSLKLAACFCSSLNEQTEALGLQDGEYGIWSSTVPDTESLTFTLRVVFFVAGKEYHVELTPIITDTAGNVKVEKHAHPYLEPANRDIRYISNTVKHITHFFAVLHTMNNRMRDEDDHYQLKTNHNQWWLDNHDHSISELADRAQVSLPTAHSHRATARASQVHVDLSEDEINKAVVKLVNDGYSVTQICQKLGITFDKAKYAVALNIEKVDATITRGSKSRVLASITLKIIKLLMGGMPQIDVATKMGVSRQRVHYIYKTKVKENLPQPE